ncbi:MAG: hypothetical protein RL385_422 [Pseudomonadota bacterium]
MPRMPAKPLVLRPKLSWSADTQMWSAVSDEPLIVVSAPTTELALQYYARFLKNKGMTKFELQPEHVLPPELQTRLAEALKWTEVLEEASQQVPRLRAQFAELAQGKFAMMQGEAARLLGISQGYLQRTTVKQGMRNAERDTGRALQAALKPPRKRADD